MILLEFVSKNGRLDQLIKHTFSTYPLTDRDRKMVTTMTHGVVKNLTLLDWRLGNIFHGDWQKALHNFKTILRLAAFEIDSLDFIPPHATINEYVNIAKKRLNLKAGGAINGILRNYLRQRKQLDPEKKFKYPATQIEIKYSMPQWLVKRWIEIWGVEHTGKMCAAFNTRPLFDLKVNEKVIQVDEFEQLLRENGIIYTRSDYFPDIFKLSDIQKIRNLKLFEKGYCIVQDESARLAVQMLDIHAGDYILDACAAPGGKLSVMSQLISGKITTVAMDIDEARIRMVRDNCGKIENKCLIVRGDGRIPPFKEKFNKILVDAPCSGLGTLQKNPDIKWRRKPDEILSFQRLQIEILDGVSEYLAENGVLVYSTCSIDPAENEDVISRFLEIKKNLFGTIPPPVYLSKFQSDGNSIRTFPHIHLMDGTYAIRLVRTRIT